MAPLASIVTVPEQWIWMRLAPALSLKGAPRVMIPPCCTVGDSHLSAVSQPEKTSVCPTTTDRTAGGVLARRTSDALPAMTTSSPAAGARPALQFAASNQSPVAPGFQVTVSARQSDP